MLERLEVRGLGIIEKVRMELPAGFIALTGETGAGKSLLVESLKLLSGHRAHSDLVRTGDDTLRAEGVFAVTPGVSFQNILDDIGIDCDDELVLRREISASGRSRAWINDTSVTASTLQRIAPFLLAIHGQHEQYGLADPREQRKLVDEFAGHHALLESTQKAYQNWRLGADEVEKLRSTRAQRRDRLDVITFQIAEIDDARLHEGEDQELIRHRQIMRNRARLVELSTGILDDLAEGDETTLDLLARAERRILEMTDCGLLLKEAAEQLTEARVRVEEVVRSIQDVHAEFDQETSNLKAGDLEAVESRLHLLEQLMYKYGSPIDKVIEHRRVLENERQQLATIEDDLDAALQIEKDRLDAYATIATKLDASRNRSATKLTASVESVLGRLAMEGTRLEFRWYEVPDSGSPLERHGNSIAFTTDGIEECELFFAANRGEDPRPMARVASGGELSRLHLALRTVLRSKSDSSPRTLLFDEVDSGLGGATAAALAALLGELSEHDQVLAVTHLPQVAAQAAGHFRIEKTEKDKRAKTAVHALDLEARESEIARMLAGAEVTATALDHARDLLNGATSCTPRVDVEKKAQQGSKKC